jgi:predicted dehydrogenase
VDNQVVNMSFEDGSTASMTMTAFNFNSGRKTRIFGTKGEIDTNSQIIKIRHFLDDTERVVDTQALNDGGILSGHGGGDNGLMHNFIQAVSEGDPSLILTGVDETLESHLMVFAAEKSRRENIVCKL